MHHGSHHGPYEAGKGEREREEEGERKRRYVNLLHVIWQMHTQRDGQSVTVLLLNDHIQFHATKEKSTFPNYTVCPVDISFHLIAPK